MCVCGCVRVCVCVCVSDKAASNQLNIWCINCQNMKINAQDHFVER